MTVVVYRDGVMAADREAGNQYLKSGRVTKIRVLRGHLVGISGDLCRCMEWLDWFDRGADPDNFPASLSNENNFVAALVVGHDGKPWKYEFTAFPFCREESYTAIGTGFEAAMAAMYCGKTAAEAVGVAIAICQGCGGGVDVLTISDIDAA